MLLEKAKEIKDNFRKKSPAEQLQIVGLIVLRVLVTLIAVFLSWTCNATSGIVMRLVLAVISAVFAEIYILYYTVYHILMGVKCGIKKGDVEEDSIKTLTASLIKGEKKPVETGFPFKQKSKFTNYLKSIKSVL